MNRSKRRKYVKCWYRYKSSAEAYETTHTSGFVGLAVCLVVWTPLFLFTPLRVGIFHRLYKNKTKQQTEGERKKQTKRGFRTAKRRKVKLELCNILCVYVHGYRENSTKILHSNKRCWLISAHRLRCSVSSFLTPNRSPTILDPRLRADWPAPRLGLESLTLCSRVSLLTPNVLRPISQVFMNWALR